MPLSQHTVIYGGSFNPPHIGHQTVCLYLLCGLGASEVWLLPTFNHPLGKTLIPFEHRMAMCERMAEPLASQVKVLDLEARLGGAGRTFDLVQKIQTQYPQKAFALALGSDVRSETEQWYRWDDICARVKTLFIGRQGHGGGSLPGPSMPEISSSQLRQWFGQGRSCEGFLPKTVRTYIDQHNLYR